MFSTTPRKENTMFINRDMYLDNLLIQIERNQDPQAPQYIVKTTAADNDDAEFESSFEDYYSDAGYQGFHHGTNAH
jgi:hypothetical protein